MKTFAGLSWLPALATLSTLSSIPGIDAQNNTPSAWPLHDNGLNDVVQWDHYSFKVNITVPYEALEGIADDSVIKG
jgi:hypothetical protein